jgi:hypothetical protein
MSAAVIAMRNTFSCASALPATPTASAATSTDLLTGPADERFGVEV